MEKRKRKAAWLPVLLLCLLFAGVLSGTLTLGEQESGVQTAEAAARSGWYLSSGGNWYYYQNGKKVMNNWVKDKGEWYYLKPKTGVMARNMFITWKNKVYYLDDSGKMVTGWLEIASGKYRFSRNGIRYRSGWHTIEGRRYYINKDGTVRTGWFSDNGKKYYLAMTGKNKGAAAVGTYNMSGYRRTFNANGELVKTVKIDSAGSTAAKNQLQKSTGAKTLRNYLLEALRAVGPTDYVLGGGWQPPYCTSRSVPSGMDCSGFVGWTTYQLMGNTPHLGYNGYVVKSYDLARTYASWGWGTLYDHSALAKNNYKGRFMAGDILCRKFYLNGDPQAYGHTWIVLGQCPDGSYVLVHCSPPCAQIAGTPDPATNSADSQAIQLAKTYMQRYYKDTLESHHIQENPPTSRTWATDLCSYVSDDAIECFHWSGRTLSDPDGFKDKSAVQILKSLFGE